MVFRQHDRRTIRIAMSAFLLAISADAASRGAEPEITIGGVVFTDVQDPMRSGLEGVTVTIDGEAGNFQTTTSGLIGLWKVDVPEGMYTVTPKKKDYAIEHLVGTASDGQRSITIEVTPRNLAANQSIRFLAVEWPEEEAVPSEIRDSGQPGGGCAVLRGGQSRIVDFAVPYAACVGALLVAMRVDLARNSRRKRGRQRQ
jgi:hypothetical protein